MGISDWSSDVCSSDLVAGEIEDVAHGPIVAAGWAWPALRDAEALLEAVVAEALGHDAVVGDHHRAADQLRVFAQQQLPFRLRGRALAVVRQLPPGGGRLVDQRLEAAGLPGPFDQGFRAGFFVARSEEHTSELPSLMRISYA